MTPIQQPPNDANSAGLDLRHIYQPSNDANSAATE
jgi:hypothetical protein